jgi:predicted enzyme related to lactoylglutathione lyase
MDNPIVHFEILGREGPSLIGFYRDLFGWELRDVPVNGYRSYAFIPSPDEGIGGGVGQLESDDHGFVTVYVEVADPQSILDQAVKSGAHVALPVTEIPGVGEIARFQDPQGNVVGLVRSIAE